MRWESLERVENVICGVIVHPMLRRRDTLISSSEKGDQPMRPTELFDVMKRQGVVRNVTAYFALISAYEKRKTTRACF